MIDSYWRIDSSGRNVLRKEAKQCGVIVCFRELRIIMRERGGECFLEFKVSDLN